MAKPETAKNNVRQALTADVSNGLLLICFLKLALALYLS